MTRFTTNLFEKTPDIVPLVGVNLLHNWGLQTKSSQVNFISDTYDIRIYLHKKIQFLTTEINRNKSNCNSSNQKQAKVFSNVRG